MSGVCGPIRVGGDDPHVEKRRCYVPMLHELDFTLTTL
jgi:hypothetical protein